MRHPHIVLALLVVCSFALAGTPARAGDVRFVGLEQAPRAGVVAAPIYNGRPTGGFPAVVAVGIENQDGSSGLCSGTLITPKVVLTAGHCVAGGLRAAAIAYFPDGVTEVDRAAFAFAVNPDFNLALAAVADAGVLVIDPPVTDVAPIALAAAAPRARARGTIVGFGNDDSNGAGVKREGTVRLRRCPRAVRRVGIVPGQLRDSICWRPKRRGNDTCSGDSGGPLLVGGAVAGITSGGFPDCPGKLSWDTSVAAVRAWLDAALAKAETLTPPAP